LTKRVDYQRGWTDRDAIYRLIKENGGLTERGGLKKRWIDTQREVFFKDRGGGD
jgi:hypothetical protein